LITVIQCAAKKQPDAGSLRTADGKPVVFVAKPDRIPPDGLHLYARPDDMSENGKSWRELLLEYNSTSHDNPLGLLPAYRLYENRTYTNLVGAFGLENIYILSAGWGLIRASFLTPCYDITFSASAAAHTRRRRGDIYHDFCMIPNHTHHEIVFLGGKDYIPLFCLLTSAVQTRKLVFFNSAFAPETPGCTSKRFVTPIKTNWHYACAKALIDVSITL
jgi:hypothetical protein